VITTLVTAASLLLTAQTTVRPAAFVLDAGGRVELRPSWGLPTAATIGTMVYPDERLVVGAGGALKVSILAAGVTESIRSGVEVTVGQLGCLPAGAVLKREHRPACVAEAFKNLRPASDDVRRAGVGLRAGPDDPKAMTPVSGATVATERPGLAWPEARGATAYRVKLLSGARRLLWQAKTRSASVDFPKDQPPLQRGHVFRWEVTDQDLRPVAAGEFTVATESECEQMDELKTLAAGRDRSQRLEAAMAYRRLGAFQEEMAIYEGLVAEFPDEPAYLRPLAELRRLSGRPHEPDARNRP
jgi:hypothetical protein